MVGLSPTVETVLDERAKDAVLLVDAVEERANVTVVAGSNPGELRGVPGGLHNSRFHAQSPAQSCVQPGRTGLPPPGSISYAAQARPGSAFYEQGQNTPSLLRCRR